MLLIRLHTRIIFRCQRHSLKQPADGDKKAMQKLDQSEIKNGNDVGFVLAFACLSDTEIE